MSSISSPSSDPQNPVAPSLSLNFIGGEFVPAIDGQTLTKNDPATGEINAHVAASDLMDVVRAIQAANKALVTWVKSSTEERVLLLENVADLIEKEVAGFALAQARDIGTPVSQTFQDSVPQAASFFRSHAALLRELPANPLNESRAPVGLIGLLTPASDPLVCLASRVAAALAGGNAVIAKVSSRTPETGALFARLIGEAGWPAGLFACLQGRGVTVGEALVQHPGISTLSFMGSNDVGRRVNVMAAESLKRLHLSLGAKNPVLLFSSVDLSKIIPQVAAICVGLFPSRNLQGSRLFIQESIFKEALELLKIEFDAIRVGSPLDRETQVGPLPTEASARLFRDSVAMAKKENGRRVTADAAAVERGNFVQPILFADLTNCSTLQQAEILGPLVLASSFKYQHEALKHANVSPYGRAAYVFEADEEKSQRLIPKLEVGRVFLNSSKPLLSPLSEIPLLKQSGSNDEGARALAKFFTRTTIVSRA